MFFKKIKNILKLEVFKITSLNSIVLIVQFFTSIISGKIIALVLGPIGVGLLGNFRDFVSTMENLITLGFKNGIIKKTSNYDLTMQEKLCHKLKPILHVLLLSSIVFGGLTFFFSKQICHWILNHHQYYWSVRLYSIVMPFIVISIFFGSILNGLGFYKKIIYIQLCQTLIGLGLTLFFIIQFQFRGALISSIIIFGSLFILTLYFTNNVLPVKQFFNFNYHFNKTNIKPLFSYTLMALTSGIVIPLVHIAIRNQLNLIDPSDKHSGFWESIRKFSSIYMSFIVSIVNLYFFPKLSKAVSKTTNNTLKSIIKEYCLTILPISFVAMLGIYLLRRPIILLYLTEEFLVIDSLFIWQLTGDLFRATSLIFGMLFFVYRDTKGYIITELISYTCFFILSYFLMQTYLSKGIVIAYLITYIGYLLILLGYFHKKIHQH